MQQTMAGFRAELQRDQDESVERAAKKARLAAEVTFRRKGNEKQYRFNEAIQEKMSTAALRFGRFSLHRNVSVGTNLGYYQCYQ